MVRNSAIKLLQPSLILRFPNIHQPWTLICHENESTKIILESFGFEFSKKHMCRSIFSGKESHPNRNIYGLHLFEYMPSYGNLCSSSLMRIQQSVNLDLITCRVYNRRSISRLAHLMLCNTNIYVCDITLISSVTESLYAWGGEQALGHFHQFANAHCGSKFWWFRQQYSALSCGNIPIIGKNIIK